jgi:dTDP-4-amino-4,6-dideoxygalactose transaminase
MAELGAYLGIRHLFAFNSGRTALYAVLKSALAPRSKVILPGYTCYTVAAAVTKAGMTPILSDNNHIDLGYDLDELRRTLTAHPDCEAIVVCHLFGIVQDIEAIRKIVGSEILIIDDAAQAFGIQAGGKWLGTGGHAGFYSFGRGKNLSLVGGGLLVTNTTFLAERLRAAVKDEFPTPKSSFAELLRATAYNFAVRPSVFGFISRLPGTEIGRSEFDPQFDAAGLSCFKIRLLQRIYKQAEILNAERREVSRRYLACLEGNSMLTIPRSSLNREPGNLRFVVLVGDQDKRTRILTEAKRRGWGLTAMYPSTLAGVIPRYDAPEFRLKGSEHIARSIITLPTHRQILKADAKGKLIDHIAELFT